MSDELRALIEPQMKRLATSFFTEENFDDPESAGWNVHELTLDSAPEEGDFLFVESSCTDSAFAYDRVLFVVDMKSDTPQAVAACTPEGLDWELLAFSELDSWRTRPTAIELLGAYPGPGGLGCLLLLLLIGGAAAYI